MYPVLFEYGRIAVFTYGALIAVGFLAALWVGGKQAERLGFGRRAFQDLSFAVIVCAVVGSRLFYVLLEWQEFARNPLDVFALWKGGLVFYGALAGAAVAVLAFCRVRRLSAWTAADTVAPGLVLGQAFGRLGCFLAGCCHGAPTDRPWGVVFRHPRAVVAPECLGVPLHPTQLYEAASNFALFAVLYLVVTRRRRFEGQVFGVYLLAYPAIRFILEFFRGDPRGAFGPLSTSQLVGIPLFVLGLWIVLSGARGARPA